MSEIFWIRDLNLQGNLIEDVKDLAWLNSLDELESIVLFNNNNLLDKINENCEEALRDLPSLTDKLRNFVKDEAQKLKDWILPKDNFSIISSKESNSA